MSGDVRYLELMKIVMFVIVHVHKSISILNSSICIRAHNTKSGYLINGGSSGAHRNKFSKGT